MDIINTPFVQTVGLHQARDGALSLELAPSVLNHLNTMHASAQFTLAETASGQILVESFPELVGKVVPVLRDSQVKFKRPAETAVTAHASISSEASKALLEQFDRRGRGTIEVQVDIKDTAGKVTCSGTFNWYIQSITT